jgi:predicted DNA-binding mobile mystery protein A
MHKSDMSARARRELDRKFSSTELTAIAARPRAGWIRAVRGALGMSQAVLAQRHGVTRAAVEKLEQAEIHGGVTVAKLAQVAGAMDCTLIYALVPNDSLEATVNRQARARAEAELGYASRTMALEAQGVPSDRASEAVQRYADDLIATGRVWRERAGRRRVE